METRIEKEVRVLKIYAAIATLACAVFCLSAFVLQTKKQKFEEIDVERINIVEKDGKLRMVISRRRASASRHRQREDHPQEGPASAGNDFLQSFG